MIFYTADTHFGHGGALGLYRRPFASVAAMDEEIERRWNEAVAPGDEVWHVGDVALGPRTGKSALAFAENLAARLRRLNGRKHLLIGNNDADAVIGSPVWASVAHYREIVDDGAALVLCHYPLRSWNGMSRGALNLHGHSHGRLRPLTRQFDVGVDVREFRPVTLQTLRRGEPRGR